MNYEKHLCFYKIKRFSFLTFSLVVSVIPAEKVQNQIQTEHF